MFWYHSSSSRIQSSSSTWIEGSGKELWDDEEHNCMISEIHFSAPEVIVLLEHGRILSEVSGKSAILCSPVAYTCSCFAINLICSPLFPVRDQIIGIQHGIGRNVVH